MELPAELMKFVSEKDLEEAKKTRGERVEDGTAQRDKPLHEVLRENKNKKDAEFNERFKHRPPKALDEDESDFLDTLQRSRKEYERRIADEEAQELQSFKTAKASLVHELKETSNNKFAHDPVVLVQEEHKFAAGKNKKKNPLLGMIIKVKEPQAKRAKVEESANTILKPHCVVGSTDISLEAVVKTPSDDARKCSNVVAMAGLVSYSDDDSDDD